MVLGSMDSGARGNSSTSASNLSALAPPFTVHRSNSKHNSSTFLHYTEPPYAAELVSQSWQSPLPSAPRPELNIDSTLTTSTSPVKDCQFWASPAISPLGARWSVLSPGARNSKDAFSFAGEFKPYYTPYLSTIVGEERPLVVGNGPSYDMMPANGLGVSSQVDYTQSLSGFEYRPLWDDGSGFDSKWAKLVEPDGSFSSERANVGGSHVHKNYMTEGGHNIEYGNKPKEHSGISYGKFNHASKRESHAESLNSGHMDDTPRMEQYLGFSPYESSRTHSAASCSTYPESHPLASPLEVPKNSFNCPNLYQPYEKCGQPLDSSLIGIISVTRSSPTVVIRSPPAGISSLPRNSVACKTADLNDIAIVHSKESDGCYPSNLKYFNSESTGDPFSTSQSEFCRQGNDQISLISSSVEELSSPLLSKDTLDNSVKARCVSNLPDINVLDHFAVATNGAQGVNSTQNFSDCIDHQNPAVDSPCWKGAPASHFLPFDDVVAGKSNHSKEKLDECYGFDHEEHQNLLSFNDSVTTASQKPCERSKPNNNGYAREGMPLSSKTAPYANCPAREQSSAKISPTSSGEVVQLFNALDKPIKEFELSNNSKSSFDLKFPDSKRSSSEDDEIAHMQLSLQAGSVEAGITHNDVSEGGTVAFHAAKKFLCSPSQENALEHAKLPQDQKPYVQTIIKAMHNLSELLLFHFPNGCALEEHNYEALKHVITNLDACLMKDILRTNKQEPVIPLGDISQELGESYDMGSVAGKLQVISEVVESHAPRHVHEEKINYNFSGNEAENSLHFLPLRDDVDIASDDDLAQAIKKILDKNFHCNEEMPSKAHLFRNLWLETEAKLCSIIYKARFDHMKIEMETIKSNRAKDGIIPKSTLQNSSISSTSGCLRYRGFHRGQIHYLNHGRTTWD